MSRKNPLKAECYERMINDICEIKLFNYHVCIHGEAYISFEQQTEYQLFNEGYGEHEAWMEKQVASFFGFDCLPQRHEKDFEKYRIKLNEFRIFCLQLCAEMLK